MNIPARAPQPRHEYFDCPECGRTWDVFFARDAGIEMVVAAHRRREPVLARFVGASKESRTALGGYVEQGDW